MLGPVKKCVEGFIAANPSFSVRTDRVVYFDVTNRRIDGSCYLFFAGEEESPTMVAKAARTEAGKAVFEIEYDNLQQLHAMGMNREGPTTPEPLGRWTEGETLITLQSALRGTLMKNVPGNRLFAPDRIEANLDRVFDWWDRLQERFDPRRLRLSDEVYESEVLSEVRRFRRRYRLETDEEEFLERRFFNERPLAGVELPLMVRHGDFCAANMVMQEHGIGVIDWEFPLAHRTPLFDLFFFFSSMRFPFTGVGGEAAHSDSFVEVYWGKSYFTAAMRDRLIQCCRVFDIPTETLPDLLTLSLIQTANMKYDGLMASHEMQENETETITDEEKVVVWSSFQRPDKDAPFACIRDGVYENLRHVVRRGLPRFE